MIAFDSSIMCIWLNAKGVVITPPPLKRNSVVWALSNLVILLYHTVLITQVLLFLPVEKANRLQDNLTVLLGLADVDIHQPPVPSSTGK